MDSPRDRPATAISGKPVLGGRNDNLATIHRNDARYEHRVFGSYGHGPRERTLGGLAPPERPDAL